VPWLLKKYIEKNMPKDEDDRRQNINNQPSEKDKIIPDDKGEYIDFEELDEKDHESGRGS
jgi:hypothetical protein